MNEEKEGRKGAYSKYRVSPLISEITRIPNFSRIFYIFMRQIIL